MRSTIDDRDIVINQGGKRGGFVGVRAILALAGACFALALVVLLVQQLRGIFDPLAREAAAQELYRAQQLDGDLYAVDMIAGAVLRLVLPVGLAFGLLGVVIVGLVLVYQRWAAPVAVQAYFHVRMVEAQHSARVPTTLTYSPHISSKHDVQSLPDAGAIALPDVNIPTFSTLLDRGAVGKGNPLLLGVDVESGENLTGSWLDLYSTAIGGLPGTGKTTSQRFLANQVALQGAAFVVIDPHAGAGSDSLAETLAPLRSIFLCDPASDDKAILQAVNMVADIGQKRVKGDRNRQPVILWLDETTALLNRSTVGSKLAELLEEIAQEYRKVGVYCAASGQIWTAERSGGSAVRDSFASVLAHRMKRSQARMLLPTLESQQCERLDTGRAVLWRTSGATNVVAIPDTTANDVVRVAGLLEANAAVLDMPQSKPNVSHLYNVVQVENTASQSVKSVSPEAARALGLFLDNKRLPEIVLELRNVKSNQGATYQRASAEIEALIREAIAARGH